MLKKKTVLKRWPCTFVFSAQVELLLRCKRIIFLDLFAITTELTASFGIKAQAETLESNEDHP